MRSPYVRIPHPFFCEMVESGELIWALDATSGTDEEEMGLCECIVISVSQMSTSSYRVLFMPTMQARALVESGEPLLPSCYSCQVIPGEVLTFVPGTYVGAASSPRSSSAKQITGDFRSTHAMLEARIEAYTDPGVAAIAEFTKHGLKTRNMFYPQDKVSEW